MYEYMYDTCTNSWCPVGSSPIDLSQVDSTRSVHYVDGSSQGQFYTSQFITKTVIYSCNRL